MKKLDKQILLDSGKAFNSALAIAQTISDKGFVAYVVGGGVRDALIGIVPDEVDIATNAPREMVAQLFPDARPIFPDKYGAMQIVGDDRVVEIARMRKDVISLGRQAEIEFTDEIDEDLRRRDFTVNAIAIMPDLSIIDRFSGYSDLLTGIIRSIGEPETRFREDNLRILRAVRFAAQLDFNIETKTAEAVRKCASLVENLSPGWLWREFRKGFRNAVRFRRLIIEYDIFNYIFNNYFKYSDYDIAIHAKIQAITDNTAVRWIFFFYDNPRDFAERMKLACARIEFPHDLRKDILDIARVIEAIPLFFELNSQNKVRILDSHFFTDILKAALLYDEFKPIIEKIRVEYPAFETPSIITGNDIKEILVDDNRIGKILAEIRLAQFRGDIIDKKEALELVNKMQSYRGHREKNEKLAMKN